MMHSPEPVNSSLRASLFRAGSPLELDTVRFSGHHLQRPECVLATASGDVYCADWRGGVTHILADGTQRAYLGHEVDGEGLKPNGIALLKDGSFLLAHLGAERGGIFRLERNGAVQPFLERVDGIDLPPSNFVVEDAFGRFWITVSTRLQPRALGYRRSCNDGFIVLVDGSGARIVADGLGYTNECAIDSTGRWLYVNETFARRLSRFPVRQDGTLGKKQVITDFGVGTFPDGVTLDGEGGLWVTSIVSNRLIQVAPDGRQTLWLEDAESDHLSWVEQAFDSNRMDRSHLEDVKSRHLRNISSLAFGGADLRTGYLGCLLGYSLATFRMPVAGLPPIHWNYPNP